MDGIQKRFEQVLSLYFCVLTVCNIASNAFHCKILASIQCYVSGDFPFPAMICRELFYASDPLRFLVQIMGYLISNQYSTKATLPLLGQASNNRSQIILYFNAYVVIIFRKLDSYQMSLT